MLNIFGVSFLAWTYLCLAELKLKWLAEIPLHPSLWLYWQYLSSLSVTTFSYDVCIENSCCTFIQYFYCLYQMDDAYLLSVYLPQTPEKDVGASVGPGWARNNMWAFPGNQIRLEVTGRSPGHSRTSASGVVATHRWWRNLSSGSCLVWWDSGTMIGKAVHVRKKIVIFM